MSKHVLPESDLVKHMILQEFQTPVIFHGFINDWELISWTEDVWVNKLGNRILPFRVGVRKYTKVPQWETQCETINMTMKEFVSSDLHESDAEEGQLQKWMYFDYKYMNEWFAENLDILDSVSWKNFGFPERGGADSTIWIGNNGAHTPCHMDSYGCNLVAQVHGRKQWILFPPEKTSLLKPTRIPYEESSIYSNINFYTPHLNLPDELSDAFVVTLNPGDVLFVPSHWWHYVENKDIAISINTWIPLPSDDECRLQEALVRLFISQVCKDLSEEAQLSLLNPNELELADIPPAVTLEQIEICRKKCEENNPRRSKEVPVLIGGDQSNPHVNKKLKVDCVEGQSSEHIEVNETDFLEKFQTCIKPVQKCASEQFREMLKQKQMQHMVDSLETNLLSEKELRTRSVINAFCHPDIISQVKDKILL